MSKLLVSVVIDNYNFAQYVGDAIESVLDQTLPAENIELIVVDDGSTDDSRRVIESFGRRVRRIYQENQGQAMAFNTGIKSARGDTICLLDSDDYWHPQKLEKVVAMFQKHSQLGLVQHFLRDVDAQKKALQNPFPDWRETATIDDFLNADLPFAATSGMAFKRDILKKVPPIPKDVFCYVDNYLTTRALLMAPMGNLSEILGYHRVHGDNFWAQKLSNPENIAGELAERENFHKMMLDWMREYGKEFTPRYLEIEALDILRRRILLEAYRGARVKACALWYQGLRAHWSSPLGCFRLLTCMAALISPHLYVSLYNFYGRHHVWAARRSRLFPDLASLPRSPASP